VFINEYIARIQFWALIRISHVLWEKVGQLRLRNTDDVIRAIKHAIRSIK